MNRVNVIESISGINYPEMIITFFDHFIALKQLVEDSGSIQVLNSSENSISFSIVFNNNTMKMNALNIIKSYGNMIVIYGRYIIIQVEELSDSMIKINLI